MYETIAIIATLVILFIITWIVIACNSDKDFEPLPMVTERFKDTWEYKNMYNNINSCEVRIRNMEIENTLQRVNPIFATKELNLNIISDEILLKEVRKRGLLETKEIVK